MDETERRQALANFLRTRRARLRPADVDLPAGLRRRTAGLRREEVAQLANIGISWYTSLEQGRDVRPSEQVLESLAQALRLTETERQHLFLLALQHAPAQTPPSEEQVSLPLQQMVNNLHPHPAYVMGRRSDVLFWNEAAEHVFPYFKAGPLYPRNIVWNFLTDPKIRATSSNWELVAQGLVAGFRADSARYPGDAWFAELIEDLQRTSAEFRLWWSQHNVHHIPDCHKEINHPRLGLLVFEHIALQASTSPDLKVVIYNASPATVVKIEQLLRTTADYSTRQKTALR